ncbi:protein IG [Psittacid alphaherpesvirus 1]|uniref:protein IG n=1 Tax=Psittacid alphaherpesvirus 1 TaxID=50294 RepID=UPI000153681A|nr:protein IG [Psittacid alphaherpesvirus 1]
MNHTSNMVLKRARNGMLYMGFKKLKCGTEGYKRNEEGFACESCSATFSGEAHMKIHVQEHRSSHRLMCAFCAAPFAHLHRLRSHAKQCTRASVSRALELSLELGGKRHAEFEATLAAVPNLDLDSPYLEVLAMSANRKTQTVPRRQRRERFAQRRPRGSASWAPPSWEDADGTWVGEESQSAAVPPQTHDRFSMRGRAASSEAYSEALAAETSEAANTLLSIMREQDALLGYGEAPKPGLVAF